MGRALIIDPLNWSVDEKEEKMEKKYLKKVLTGLSIASLVTGIGGLAVSASGWSGGQKSAGSTQEVKKEAPASGYGEEKKEAAAGYGTPSPAAAPGYGTPVPAPGYGGKAEEKKTE